MVIGRVYLHFGYPEQPMKFAEAAAFLHEIFPHNVHSSASGSSGWCAMRVP